MMSLGLFCNHRKIGVCFHVLCDVIIMRPNGSQLLTSQHSVHVPSSSLVPVFVALSSNIGNGLVKLIMCSDMCGRWYGRMKEWLQILYTNFPNLRSVAKTAWC